MGNSCKTLKRTMLSLAGVALVFFMILYLSGSAAYALTADDNSKKTVLAFTSDIHNTGDNTAANRLDAWMDKVENKYGPIDVMSFCGDMGSARAAETEYWAYAKSVVDVVDGESVRGVYTTGNHEFYNGKYDTTENTLKGSFTIGETGAEGSNYIIYCLGSDNWDNRKDNYPEAQIADLKSDLESMGNDKPIIVLTHFPLHTFGSGNRPRQTANADKVIDVLNDAAADGKKIVFLWGHNHTVNDTYYDQIYAPGDSIEYKSGSSKELKFYYGAAGCMSDSEYGSGSAFVKGKGLVITIDEDKDLSFTYYDANANNVTEGGTFSEEPVQAESLVIDESVQKGEDGKIITTGQTILKGKKLRLHLTLEPEDAYQKGLKWSSSDEAVATVTQEGVVKGLSEGTVTITATIPASDTTKEVTATIEVTVQKRDRMPEFVLTDKLEAGKNYVIASSKTGSAFALTNDEGTATATAVEISGDKIKTDDESLIFKVEEGSDGGFNISNDKTYLQVSRNRISFEDSAPSDRPWSYSEDNKLSCKGRSGDYYLFYDGSAFTAVRGSATSETTPAPKTEASAGTQTNAATEAATETKTDAATETKTDAATEAKTEAATETKTDAATETKTEAATETKTDTAAGTQANTATETQTNAPFTPYEPKPDASDDAEQVEPGEVYLFVETQPKAASITYKLDGGTYNGSSEDIVETHYEGDVITIHKAPQKEGYLFNYWEGSEYYPGDSYTVGEDHTFTAVWTANESDDEGGAAGGDDEEGTSGDDTDKDKSSSQSTRVRTGDDTQLVLWIAIAAAAAAAIAVLIIIRMRKRSE